LVGYSGEVIKIGGQDSFSREGEKKWESGPFNTLGERGHQHSDWLFLSCSEQQNRIVEAE
jgi:hypothetical protein